MYTDSKKIHLIEEMLKVGDQAVLKEIESVLKKSKKRPGIKKTLSAHDFAGAWSKKDAALIEKAIEQTCEQIHPDDWK